MSDLDAVGAGGQQARIDQQVDDMTIDRRPFELGVGDLASCMVGAFARLHETKEEPFGL